MFDMRQRVSRQRFRSGDVVEKYLHVKCAIFSYTQHAAALDVRSEHLRISTVCGGPQVFGVGQVDPLNEIIQRYACI